VSSPKTPAWWPPWKPPSPVADPVPGAGVDTVVLRIDTSRRQVVDLTGDLKDFCQGKGDGLCSVFVPHATAGVAVMELGSGSESDLIEALARWLPRDDRYRHRHGATGHGADHLLPVLVSPSLVVPVVDGRPALGTWQSLVLVDMNADNPHRQVRLSLVPAR
jgi:secondary thiamine-phosphate synthase enzyme